MSNQVITVAKNILFDIIINVTCEIWIFSFVSYDKWFFFVVQFDNVILQKKNYYASLTVPSAWPISKNRRKLQKYNIASFALHSTIKTSGGKGGNPNPSLHCVIPKVAINISIFRWPLLEPNIFTVHCLLFLILHIYLYDDLLRQEFFYVLMSVVVLKKYYELNIVQK